MRSLPSVWRAMPPLAALATALVLSSCGATGPSLTPASLAAVRIPLPEARPTSGSPSSPAWGAATLGPVARGDGAMTPALAVGTSGAEVVPPAAPALDLTEKQETGGDTVAPGRDVQRGVASFYASRFHGRTTASGDTYDETRLSAAHRTLPFGSRVRVTNLANDRQLVLTVTDRGPFARGRIIDVSREAARRLGFLRRGTIPVEVAVLGPRSSD